ncbi:MAG TPA: hypothetical protein PLV92_05360, partial [Pirellulaceae bacterium]|nr:hypothetical protein [Pirellulaceae bacterium]
MRATNSIPGARWSNDGRSRRAFLRAALAGAGGLSGAWLASGFGGGGNGWGERAGSKPSGANAAFADEKKANSQAAAEFKGGAADERPSALTITKVETFALQHKLPKAVGPSVALSDIRSTLLVKISTDSGLVGWGETADVGGTRGIIDQHLKKVLVGKNPLEHRKVWRAMWGANFGDGRAVAGCDLALHDLRGKALGLSVSELYGGRQRDKVLGYAAAMNYTEGVAAEE